MRGHIYFLCSAAWFIAANTSVTTSGFYFYSVIGMAYACVAAFTLTSRMNK